VVNGIPNYLRALIPFLSSMPSSWNGGAWRKELLPRSAVSTQRITPKQAAMLVTRPTARLIAEQQKEVQRLLVKVGEACEGWIAGPSSSA
jgi:hypothetical protein